MSQPPAEPKIYHIVHVDRLASIIADGHLWSDAEMANRQSAGTAIGMTDIKARRRRLRIDCRPGLCVGDCVPFYFCPRSVMLYLLYRGNHRNLTYTGGQRPILHLEGDLRAAVAWAEANGRRWAFTLSNAGAFYFDDRCDLDRLDDIDWHAVRATTWSGPGISGSIKDSKQAEFLVERSFPWALVERIGVLEQGMARDVASLMQGEAHRPAIEVKGNWYY